MEKLIITAAICGAEVTKKHNPAVPYTVEEMVREAKSAFEAGAAVIHVHVREDDGTPTQDRERFRVVLDAIKEACPGVILIPSTGGAVGMTAEERLQPTELFPEMATLDCGTCNFGDDVFTNDMPTMRAFGKRMMENHIKPEYECFEIGHLDTVVNMANKGEVPGAPMQFNFVLGVSGCTPATVGNLDYLVKQIPPVPPGPSPASAGARGPWWPRASSWAAMSVWASKITSTWRRATRPPPTASWWRRSYACPRSWAVRSPPPTRPERSCPWHNFCCSNLPNHTSLPQTPQPNQERNRRNFLCRRKATSTALTASSSPRAC